MNKRITTIILLFSLIAAIVSGLYLIIVFIQDIRSIDYWKKITEQRIEQGDISEDNIIPSLQSLYQRNPDLIGWIKTSDGHIDFPVMQTKSDPEYYLRRNFDKEDYSRGVPFADYRCDVVPNQGFNTVIYGHYTQSDDMFRWLLEYRYPKWYAEHKYIQFDTLAGEGTYEVVASFFLDGTDAALIDNWTRESDQAFAVYNFLTIESSKDFKRFKEEIDSQRLYETDKNLTMDSPIITLICCAPYEYSKIKENGRFVVVAQKVK